MSSALLSPIVPTLPYQVWALPNSSRGRDEETEEKKNEREKKGIGESQVREEGRIIKKKKKTDCSVEKDLDNFLHVQNQIMKFKGCGTVLPPICYKLRKLRENILNVKFE